MRMHLSLPADAGLFPAVVVIQHQGGVDEFVEKMTIRLADAGYVAAAPDLYHRDGPDCQDDIATRRSRLGDRRIINDVNACVAFMQRHDCVDRNRIGIIGFCMGGRIVYLMAAANPVTTAFTCKAGRLEVELSRDAEKRLHVLIQTPESKFEPIQLPTEVLTALGGATFRRHSNAPPKSIVRFKAISAPMTKILHRKTWRSSTPN